MKFRILAVPCLLIISLSAIQANVVHLRHAPSPLNPIPVHASLSKVRDFTLVAIEGKLSPDVIRVKRGDLVRLRFKAKDGKYAVKIPALNIKGKASPDRPFYVEFAASSPGEYEMRCTKPWSFKRWAENGKIVVE